MNNQVVLFILLASVVIQLVMLATKKFTTALIISGGTLALIVLIKIYAAIVRRRRKANTIERERARIAQYGGNITGNATYIDYGVEPQFSTKPPKPPTNDDETFETPPQSSRSSRITSGFSDYISGDFDELSRDSSSTSNPQQQIIPIPGSIKYINSIPLSFYKASEGVKPLLREVGSEPIGPVYIDEKQETDFKIKETKQKAKEMRDEGRA